MWALERTCESKTFGGGDRSTNPGNWFSRIHHILMSLIRGFDLRGKEFDLGFGLNLRV
ncbi:unnamed protein product [Prunus brigantina]